MLGGIARPPSLRVLEPAVMRLFAKQLTPPLLFSPFLSILFFVNFGKKRSIQIWLCLGPSKSVPMKGTG